MDLLSSLDSHWSLPSSISTDSAESLASTYSTRPALPNYHAYRTISTQSLSSHTSFYGTHSIAIAGPSQSHPLLTEHPIPIENMPKGNIEYCVLDDYAAVNEFLFYFLFYFFYFLGI